MLKKITNEELFRRITSGEEFVIQKGKEYGSRTYDIRFGDEEDWYIVDEVTGKKIIEMEAE